MGLHIFLDNSFTWQPHGCLGSSLFMWTLEFICKDDSHVRRKKKKKKKKNPPINGSQVWIRLALYHLHWVNLNRKAQDHLIPLLYISPLMPHRRHCVQLGVCWLGYAKALAVQAQPKSSQHKNGSELSFWTHELGPSLTWTRPGLVYTWTHTIHWHSPMYLKHRWIFYKW